MVHFRYDLCSSDCGRHAGVFQELSTCVHECVGKGVDEHGQHNPHRTDHVWICRQHIIDLLTGFGLWYFNVVGNFPACESWAQIAVYILSTIGQLFPHNVGWLLILEWQINSNRFICLNVSTCLSTSTPNIFLLFGRWPHHRTNQGHCTMIGQTQILIA